MVSGVAHARIGMLFRVLATLGPVSAMDGINLLRVELNRDIVALLA